MYRNAINQSAVSTWQSINIKVEARSNVTRTPVSRFVANPRASSYNHVIVDGLTKKSNRLKSRGMVYDIRRNHVRRKEGEREERRGKGEQQRRTRQSFDEGGSEDKVEETKECRSPLPLRGSARNWKQLSNFRENDRGEKERTAPQEKPKRIKQIWNEYGRPALGGGKTRRS